MMANKGLRTRNLWLSNGKIKCLDCDKVIGIGFEFYNVFQDYIKVGATHSLDGKCTKEVNNAGRAV